MGNRFPATITHDSASGQDTFVKFPTYEWTYRGQDVNCVKDQIIYECLGCGDSNSILMDIINKQFWIGSDAQFQDGDEIQLMAIWPNGVSAPN